MANSAMRVQGVVKNFGSVRALNGVSFEVPRNSVFGLLGPNGAGKTTLFSVSANFLKADEGSVEVLGIDVREISRLQGRLTILPQDALFQRNVPILEQLSFFRMLDGRTREVALEEVKHTLERVGLGEYMNRRVHALSHGMIKRLGLAQAFLGKPEVILLDEPTSGLDPQNARQIRDLIRELNRAEATVVVSSHNLVEVQELCDHVAILDEGDLVAAASMDEIRRSGRQVDMELSRSLTKEELQKVSELPGVSGLHEKGPSRYTATLDLAELELEADDVLRALLRALLDLEVAPRYLNEGNTLEEVFLKVTGQGGNGELAENE